MIRSLCGGHFVPDLLKIPFVAVCRDNLYALQQFCCTTAAAPPAGAWPDEGYQDLAAAPFAPLSCCNSEKPKKTIKTNLVFMVVLLWTNGPLLVSFGICKFAKEPKLVLL
jgi:hypothetical protein